VREIILSERFDFVAIVDDDDYHHLIKWRWTFKRSTRKHNNNIYATRLDVDRQRKGWNEAGGTGS